MLPDEEHIAQIRLGDDGEHGRAGRRTTRAAGPAPPDLLA